MTESAPYAVDPVRIKDQAAAISKLAADPEFLEVLREIWETPEVQRLETAERLATVDNLRQRGVSIPDGLQVTTRFFEEPEHLRASGPSICVKFALVTYGVPLA